MELDREFYTVNELAELLRMKPLTVYRMAKKREIPYYSFGRNIRFSREDVDEFLKKSRNSAR